MPEGIDNIKGDARLDERRQAAESGNKYLSLEELRGRLAEVHEQISTTDVSDENMKARIFGVKRLLNLLIQVESNSAIDEDKRNQDRRNMLKQLWEFYQNGNLPQDVLLAVESVLKNYGMINPDDIEVGENE